MIQTWAMLVDSYRELNARKLFWLSMLVSGLVVLAFLGVGINERGLVLLAWEVPTMALNTHVISTGTFYKWVFLTFGFSMWLTWAASILALVSTAGIIPDFVASGSIELTLSKPIGRARLFLTKYVVSLLYVALQVTVFSVAAFVVIGLRGGEWATGVFWSIPLVVLFFSYIYCICALVGLLTRSATASLLLTVLAWMLIFLVHAAEVGILPFKVAHELAMTEHSTQIATREKAIAKLDEEVTATRADQSQDNTAEIERLKKEVELQREQLEKYRAGLESVSGTHQKLAFAHDISFGLMTVLPKTAETMELLRRSLLSESEGNALLDNLGARKPSMRLGEVSVSGNKMSRETDKIIHSRSVAWVLGTSIAFEAVVLGVACLIFSRRDF